VKVSSTGMPETIGELLERQPIKFTLTDLDTLSSQ